MLRLLPQAFRRSAPGFSYQFQVLQELRAWDQQLHQQEMIPLLLLKMILLVPLLLEDLLLHLPLQILLL